MSLLEVAEVSKAFGGVQALSGISLAVDEHDIVGLMGANGAGKTTLFAVIAGHLRADEGRIDFDGRRVDGLRPDRICRAGIARTFQIVRPFRGLTALENVATAARFGAKPADGTAAAMDTARSILAELGLERYADQEASSLPLSAQKKLEVARALATGPRLLLLDEVMAGLSPSEVREMMAMISGIRERHGLSILLIEHVMRALMEMSRHIVVLHHGVKIAEGSPDAIADHPEVQQAYLGAPA